MATTHILKIWCPYFDDIIHGKKTFEYRLNDRNYNPGDHLYLREFNHETDEYTGRAILCYVPYILYAGNYAIMSIWRESEVLHDNV